MRLDEERFSREVADASARDTRPVRERKRLRRMVAGNYWREWMVVKRRRESESV